MKMKAVLWATLACTALHAQEDTLINENFQGGFHYNWTTIKQDTMSMAAGFEAYQNGWVLAQGQTANDSVLASCSNFSPAGRADRWLISEPVSLGLSGNKLSWYSRSVDPSYPDGFKVLISSSGNNPADFTEVLFNQLAEPPVWGQTELDLDQLGFANQTVYLAFQHNSNDAYILQLDDILLRSGVVAKVETNDAASKVFIFPNPAQKAFTVKGLSNGRLKLYDMSGKQILENEGLSMQIETLGKGIYLVEIQSENHLEYHRLIRD